MTEPDNLAGGKSSEHLPLTKKIGFSIFIAAVFSALIPSLIIGLSGLFSLRSELLDSAINTMEAKTGAIARGIDEKIRNMGSRMDILCEDPVLLGNNHFLRMEYLHGFLDLNPVFFSAFLYDRTGKTLAAAFRNRQNETEEGYRGKNILKTTDLALANIRNLLRTKILFTPGNTAHDDRKKGSSVSELPVTMVSHEGEKMLIIARPVPTFSGNETAGALSCGVRIEGSSMDELLSTYPLHEDEFIIMTDSNGSILASSGRGVLPQGLKQLDFTPLPGKSSMIAGISIGKTRFLGVLSRIDSLDGYILCGRPRNRVFNVLTQASINLSLVLITAIAIAIFISFRVSKGIGSRIEDLAQGIKLVGRGILSHRVTGSEDDELGLAVDAFNEMAASLEKQRFIDETWNRLDTVAKEDKKQ
ncbi:MAG: hypothetical protein CVV64_09995 [Candidatus Wallbacteria bacterium HGW-Wallbacteria-1]|uniref:HAMP domain-containing protein n=1 Tax=Candidatus Wallbacteria bacterium HGW-Wallbacteria-1 TaxID=2013854 RepID=A0A2N1PPL7_9BACT|nr:MAG: hypothetical protein CVV64_09995 [Candidatus Wallbacteria bacterium HGW-Wallbacteria-1]